MRSVKVTGNQTQDEKCSASWRCIEVDADYGVMV
jgi:hypothetical protein